MRALLDALLAPWLDARAIAAIRRRIGADDRTATAFDPETFAIYRVPLPRRGAIALRHDFAEPLPVIRRTLLEWIGLGPRIYVVDSAPLALYAKDTACAVFSGLASEPALFATGRWPLWLNDLPIPLGRAATLREWVVYNRAAIPNENDPLRLRRDGPGGGVMATTRRPVLGPFPRGDRFGPPATGTTPATGGTPGTTPGGATSTPPCEPVLLCYGICGDMSPESATGNFPLLPETEAIMEAFRARGYTADHTVPQGKGFDGRDEATYEDTIASLARAIAAQTTFCRCPEDQLVIFVAAHGDKGEFLWQPLLGQPRMIRYSDLMDRLARIPAIASNPQKVYFIMLGCRSGTLFDDGVIPPALRGMHLLTSAPNSGDLSYGGTFGPWLADGLGDPNVDTWTELLDAMKGKHDTSTRTKSRPRNGDVTACFARIRLTTILYTGTNLGPITKWETRVTGRLMSGENFSIEPSGANPATAPNVDVADGFFGDCGQAKSASVSLKLKVGQYTEEFERVINFTCNSTVQNVNVTVPITDGTNTAQIVLVFQVTPSGC